MWRERESGWVGMANLPNWEKISFKFNVMKDIIFTGN